MNRALFIRNLIALGVGSTLPRKLRSYKKIYLLQCFIAGFQYYKGAKHIDSMKVGDILELRREPENEVDGNAIAVIHNSCKIGFVPARENKTLSKLIDAEIIPIYAEISHIKPEAAAWEQVRIAVYMLKEQFGPLAPHAQYLSVLKEPKYRSLRSSNKKKDWYNILEAESKTDHFYDLWYSNGPYPNMPAPTHNNDFIVIRKSRMPAYFRDVYRNHVSVDLVDIEPPYGEKDYMVMRTGQLGNYLEAAKRIEEVYDSAGNNYLELHFL